MAVVSGVALMLATVAGYVVLRPPPAPPADRVTWLRTLDAAGVTRLIVSRPGTPVPDEIWREDGSDLWLVRSGRGIGWPVPADRVRACLSILAQAGAEPPASSQEFPAEAVRVVLHTPGGERALRLAPGSLGGYSRVWIEEGDGGGVGVLADARLPAMFEPASIEAWREAAVMPGAADASRARLEASGSAVGVARTQGKWSLTAPIAAPGDAQGIAELLASFSRIRATRFVEGLDDATTGLGAPSSYIRTETDIRTTEGGDVRRRTLVQELRVGGPADAAGATAFVRAEARWEESGRPSTPAWGPTVAIVESVALAGITTRPDPLIGRQSLRTPSEDVRGVWMHDATAPGAKAEPGPPRVKLSRTLDGWQWEQSPAAVALTKEQAGGLGGLLRMLADVPASAAMVTPLKDVRPLAVVSIVNAGVPIETVSLGTATLTLGTAGPQVVIVATNGPVHRVYPALSHTPVLDFLRAIVPTEG